MVESKFWCVFVKIILLSHRNKSGVTLVYINIMYIKSSIPLRVIQIILVPTVFTLYFLKRYKEVFIQNVGNEVD